MSLFKDTLIIADGGLYQLGSDYINWVVGNSVITLDGDFTIAELQWLIDYMSSKQSGDTVSGIQLDNARSKEIE